MTSRATAAAWLQALQAQAHQAPARPREPLWLAGAGLAADAAVGSVEAALGQRLHDAGQPLQRCSGGWQVDGEPHASLASIAGWLRDARLGNGWRGELLAVTDATGCCHAAIERAVVRPLGIATHAVHLIACDAGGAMWVQQRAFDKPTDPGLWDTTMGGLQAAGESAAFTLERETWEEAGLRLTQLQGLSHVERRSIRRPLPHGYMVEHIECVDGVLPPGLQPVNQDGEVDHFECWPVDTLLQRLVGGAFTLEAAVVIAAWLQRRGFI